MIGHAARLLPYALAFFSSLCIMVLELVASRLVARHVGASLTVWTSVIGIMLGGICLGNVLGGRLADKVSPARALGPLYAIGSALTLASLWVNAAVGRLPGLDSVSWDIRTVIVVTLDFLVPATVLGMIGPVVAKMAVERAHRAGGALGDVYFSGAVGSIVGTFLAGFWLIYLAPTSTIVTVVAAALALLAAAMLGDLVGAILGVLAAILLGLGSVEAINGQLAVPGLKLGALTVNGLALAGHAAALLLAAWGLGRLGSARRQAARLEAEDLSVSDMEKAADAAPVKLGDLAVLSFLASAAFMTLEMVAGRMVQRHLGSSIYGWTSVIGVLLGGLSLGNFLGGKIADFIHDEKRASWLFLAASVLTAWVILAETPPSWLVRNPIDYFIHHKEAIPLAGGSGSFLSQPIAESDWTWAARVLFWTAAVFFLPALTMGTVSPVVAKLAVDRVRRSKRTGRAIGNVYAWGMVGSLLGTFLTGFVLIDLVGTKGLVLVLATVMALAATVLGSVWHAAWAGIPLGLCVIAFLPSLMPAGVGAFEKPRKFLVGQALQWGIREEGGDPETDQDALAYVDESDYYYIKVSNDPIMIPEKTEGPDALDDDPKYIPARKRTLVLDNLIHGYDILGHPELIEYDYEWIYALVTRRVAAAKAELAGEKRPEQVPLKTMFLGGGSYTFPRYLQHIYPGTTADIAEIDPAVTAANHAALGLKRDAPISTTFGDARQYVERNQGKKQYDLIFGDAFNDFSVPWHLTTREFNEKLANLLAPDGVYMINIIDLYESMEGAAKRGRTHAQDRAADAAEAALRAQTRGEPTPEAIADARAAAEPTERAVEESVAREREAALQCGGFLGAWINTAKQTFGHIYVFGTEKTPGKGNRETFVVVASKRALDLQGLGGPRDGDPVFPDEEYARGSGGSWELRTKLVHYRTEPYSPDDLEALRVRSRGIVLTDDYAPVENLLAPVARTRGTDD